MRYMMLMIPQVYQGKKGLKIAADFAPPAEDVAKMMKYNEDLAKAGVLIGLEGLHPAATGARVLFSEGKNRVTNGAFSDAKDVLGGYWIIDVKSKEEAVSWARRCPAQDGDVVEIRKVFEASEFPPEVQRAGSSPTVQSQLGKQGTRPYA